MGVANFLYYYYYYYYYYFVNYIFLLSLQIILKHLKFVKKFETFDFGL